MLIYNTTVEAEILVALIFCIIIFIYIFLAFYKKNVIKKSIKLNKLKELNSKYHFKSIPNYDLGHSYDNENFFEDISEEDFLTYELQFKRKQVKQSMTDVKENQKNYSLYIEEFNRICNDSSNCSNVKMKFLFKFYENKLIKKININL